MVNISSVQAYHALPYNTGWTYQASKAAVTTMSKCMALDLSVHGIRVDSICPGYIWTEHVMLYKLCFLFFFVKLFLSLSHSFLHSFVRSLVLSFPIHSFVISSFVHSHSSGNVMFFVSIQ